MTWRPSIRLFVPLVLLTPILAAVAALVTLSTLTGQRVAEDLAEQWVTGATAHVEREARDFLATAVRTSDRYARRIERGSLPADDLWAWRDRLADDLATSPELAAITFCDRRGRAIALRRTPGHLELLTLGPGDTPARVFRLEPGDPDDPIPLGTADFRPRGEAWYEAATAPDAEPAWAPIAARPREPVAAHAPAATPPDVGAAYARPLRAADGSLLGVLAVHVTLEPLSDFLRRSPLARQGSLLVLDDTGHLVAASEGPVVSRGGGRLMPLQSSSLAAQSLTQILGQPAIGNNAYPVRFNDGTPARVTVTPLRPYPGVNWRIAAVVPESVFLEDVRAAQWRATLIGVVAAVGAAVLGLILARHIVDPILQLRAHTRRIGDGRLDARLQLHSARELEELASDLNQMSARLNDAMLVNQALAVADEVQRSLLPQTPPSFPGLDVAGLARYCDATGGDYFDFVEIAADPRPRLLVAVGDVMGHGVAAALLMATARAALRTAAAAPGPAPCLGDLATRVNDLLARDASHGRFMTLALAIIEPETRTLRWASAGHDAPIVIAPAAADRPGAAAQPLEGGDLPLGVQPGVRYQEYTVPLPAGAVVVLGTDGIWEARNAAGEMYGRQRLRDLLRTVTDRDAHAIAAAVRESLAAFVGGKPLRDDVAVVVMKSR